MQNPTSVTGMLDRLYGRSDNVNITDNVDATRTEGYWYTPSGRPQHASRLYGILDYGYDGVGNRLFESVASRGTVSDQVTSYDTASNRPINIANAGTVVRLFAHDAAGNVVADNRSDTA